jgi:hypothetical protein
MRWLFDFIFKRSPKTKRSSTKKSHTQKTKAKSNSKVKPEFNYDNEEWRPVVNYEGLYEVSSMGRVRRVPRTVPVNYNGKMHQRLVESRLKTIGITPDGHPRVSLSRGSDSNTYHVKRLVAEAFLGVKSKSNFYIIKNINGDFSDVRVENLKYTADKLSRKRKPQETKMAVESSTVQQPKQPQKNAQPTQSKSQSVKAKKITRTERKMVIELSNVGYTQMQIARQVGRSITTVRRILRRNKISQNRPPNGSEPTQLRIL